MSRTADRSGRAPNRPSRPRPSGRDAGRNRKGGGSKPRPSGEFALPETITPPLPAAESFGEMDLPQELRATLTELGITAPFPIQAATLPNSLNGRDVLGRGRTGSGKTLAFGLPLLARLKGRTAAPQQPLGVVLVPTRELAQQVTETLTPYARALRMRITTVVGGMSIGRQAGALRRGAEVVVATPGRLADLLERGDCRLDQVETAVLDEADQMTDMGFLPQVTRLIDRMPPHGQRMLFSATLDRNVDRLVRRYLHDPVVHSVDPTAGTVTKMDHYVFQVEAGDKRAAATRIAARSGRVIMFVDTKRGADRIVKHMLSQGVRAAALHGGKSQPQRTRTLDWFRDGHVTALIATNVAARGIDIADLDLVVNIDPPQDHKDYLHRGGRTARAGAAGSVVTLLLSDQRRDMLRLLDAAKLSVRVKDVRADGAEFDAVTGAQTPPGTPVEIAPPAQQEPRSGSQRRRRGQGGQGQGRGGQGQPGRRQSGRGGSGRGSSGRGGSGRGNPGRRAA